MNVDLKEAAQKLASLDQAGTIGAAQKTSQMLAQFFNAVPLFTGHFK